MAADIDKTLLRTRAMARAADADAAVDEEPTLIRPRPLPENPDEDAALEDATVFRSVAAPARAFAPTKLARFPGGGLLEEAAELLQLASDIPVATDEPDPEALHAQLLERLRAFRRRAAAAEQAPALVERAAYLLCAFLDELVLNTPWGERSDWSRRSLLRLCHGETWGGERVFRDIADALETPEPSRPYLQLACVCLALGFQGKYRVRSRGQDELQTLRVRIHAQLQAATPSRDEPLMVPPAPLGNTTRGLSFKARFLLTSLTFALLAVGSYSYLRHDLNRQSERLASQLAALVPAPKPPVEAERAAPPAAHPQLARLRRRLAPEIARGVLSVEPLEQGVAVVLRAPELFGSASAELAPAYHPVLDKLGHALAAVPGQVVVAGHTDNQAIRSARYPSNWHLSLARAAAVANYLGREARLAGRLLPEGRADTQPVADNASREGRARNRRVTLELTPWE